MGSDTPGTNTGAAEGEVGEQARSSSEVRAAPPLESVPPAVQEEFFASRPPSTDPPPAPSIPPAEKARIVRTRLRRQRVVLSAVCALGGVVFALAAWRGVHGSAGARSHPAEARGAAPLAVAGALADAPRAEPPSDNRAQAQPPVTASGPPPAPSSTARPSKPKRASAPSAPAAGTQQTPSRATRATSASRQASSKGATNPIAL